MQKCYCVECQAKRKLKKEKELVCPICKGTGFDRGTKCICQEDN